jgi:drug/metabolite transporter (DMT)-like permease
MCITAGDLVELEEDKLKHSKGTLMLLLAAFIWGMAFAAQDIAADSVSAFTFNAARSYLAVIVLTILHSFRKIKLARQKASPVYPENRRRKLAAGLLCGLALFASVNLQQAGIGVYPPEAAASGRAGFLTTTYVVIVALFSFIRGKKMHPLTIAAAVICLAGLYLLCVTDGFTGIYLGDALMLGCALCFSLQIMLVDYFSDIDSIELGLLQFSVVAVLSTIGMLAFEKPRVSDILSAWVPIVYTGVFSSGIAYTLQIAGQHTTDPAPASIAMSMESVFAALGGWMLLGETMSGREIAGCALVFSAVLLTQLPQFLHTDPARKCCKIRKSNDNSQNNG